MKCGKMQKMESRKATGPSEVSVKRIVASGEIGIKVMLDLCQRVSDSRGMFDKRKISVIEPIFKGKNDVMSCGLHKGVELLEHVMKIVEGVLER